MPAQERLDAGELPGGERDDRLVVELELLVGESALDVGLEAHAVDDGLVERRVEYGEAALSLGFGDVHRDVGLAHERLGGRLAARPDRDSDAARSTVRSRPAIGPAR